MATKIVHILMPEFIGLNGLTAKLYDLGGSIVNGAGSGSALTPGANGNYLFTFTDVIVGEVYRLAVFNGSSCISNGGTVNIPSDTTGNYYADNPADALFDLSFLATEANATTNKNTIITAIDDIDVVVVVSPTIVGEVAPEEGTIICYSYQNNDFLLTVYESDGTTPKDLSGLTMYLVVQEDDNDTDLTKVSGLTASGDDNNQVSGELPEFSPSNTSRPCLKWALRNQANNKRIGNGVVVWKQIPSED